MQRLDFQVHEGFTFHHAVPSLEAMWKVCSYSEEVGVRCALTVS